MFEAVGLQIDPRCVKCGKPPTADTPLFEMQNHLYICDRCRQGEEQRGKRITWAGGAQVEPATATSTLTASAPAMTAMSVPKNSLFGMLEVAPTASVSYVEAAIEKKMRALMREASSDEKTQMIERLRNWKEELVSDPQFLQKQRDAVQPPKPRGSALTINNTRIYTAQELLNACEASAKGWWDAEQLLRQGELQPWILFQLGNRLVASEAKQLESADIADFRALNHLLYLLVPERPFRLYEYEKWQPVASMPNAVTPDELAALCDDHWELAEQHLYQGAMIVWLEASQGCQGISAYYETAIRPYAGYPLNRGLGLELVLERIAPKLPRPKLVVSFDGTQNEYVLTDWDREIPHAPVVIQIDNPTRGFISTALEIVNPARQSRVIEPDWMYLTGSQPSYSHNASVYICGRVGATMPASAGITLVNLQHLKRGRRYKRILRVAEQREYGGQPIVHEYPITLKTMSYYQGFRGMLWRWGLRGDLPGLVWNAVAGFLLALIFSWLLLKIVSPAYSQWLRAWAGKPLNLTGVLLACLGGFLGELQHVPHLSVTLITGVISGILGFFTGFGKGHTSYTASNSAQTFRKAALWASILLFFVLLFLLDGYKTIGFALQKGGDNMAVAALFVGGGSLLTSLLVWLILHIISMIRIWGEKALRTRYATLLTPKGRG